MLELCHVPGKFRSQECTTLRLLIEDPLAYFYLDTGCNICPQVLLGRTSVDPASGCAAAMSPCRRLLLLVIKALHRRALHSFWTDPAHAPWNELLDPSHDLRGLVLRHEVVLEIHHR